MTRWLAALLTCTLLTITALATPPSPPATTPISAPARQWWTGAVELPGPAGPMWLSIAVTFAQDGSGAWHASLDIAPGPAGPGLLATECAGVEVTPERLNFSIPTTPATTFTLSRPTPDAPEAAGQVHGEGMPPLPVTLRQVSESEVSRVVPPRPQTPRPPFPYARDAVTLTAPVDKVPLSGTLTLPPGDGPFPAVIFITDGGQQDRDHQAGYHRPYLLLADRLTRAGFATLRLDDRGIGASGGVFHDATHATVAADIRTAADFLRARGDIDPGRIGLLALGEGALPAAAAAAEDPMLGFLILLSPQALPGIDTVLLREQRRMEAEGEDPAFIAAQSEATRKLLSLVAGSGNHDQIAAALREAMLTGFASLRGEGIPPEEWQLEETVAQQLHDYTSPVVRRWMAADPRDVLGRVRIPVLLLAGDLDLTITTQDHFPAAEAALRAAGAPLTAKRFPGANHYLQPAVTGFFDEVATIRFTMMPEALDLIERWAREQAAREP